MKRENGQNHKVRIEFDDNAVLPVLYGSHNSNLNYLEKALDVRLDSFGNIVNISGSACNTTVAKQILETLYKRMTDPKDTITEISKAIVDDALRQTRDIGENGGKQQTRDPVATWKKRVIAKSRKQQEYLDAIRRDDVVFGIGPAGTGKTYLAVARGVEALKERRVERLVLSRPAVEAGERLGFLPGDMKEKVDPYLRPLYDALYDMIPPDRMERMLASEEIEIAPLAFMRGRTLAQSFVIIDEAQNTTPIQMKMLLTRLGDDSQMVVTGDLSQTDLPPGQISGLADAVSILSDVKGINITHFFDKDVVRHPIVERIVVAYNKASSKSIVS